MGGKGWVISTSRKGEDLPFSEKEACFSLTQVPSRQKKGKQESEESQGGAEFFGLVSGMQRGEIRSSDCKEKAKEKTPKRSCL